MLELGADSELELSRDLWRRIAIQQAADLEELRRRLTMARIKGERVDIVLGTIESGSLTTPLTDVRHLDLSHACIAITGSADGTYSIRGKHAEAAGSVGNLSGVDGSAMTGLAKGVWPLACSPQEIDVINSGHSTGTAHVSLLNARQA